MGTSSESLLLSASPCLTLVSSIDFYVQISFFKYLICYLYITSVFSNFYFVDFLVDVMDHALSKM